MTDKKNGVYAYMDCSTGHITPEDSAYLADCVNERSEKLLIVRDHPYGFWVHVLDEQDFQEVLDSNEISPGLKAVLTKAKKFECRWVNLDRDGDEHDDLETFDWSIEKTIKNIQL